MCSNEALDNMECYMDEIFDAFEAFLKKSLIVVSLSIGTVVLLLLYMVTGQSGLNPCCLTNGENEAASASGGGGAAGGKGQAPGTQAKGAVKGGAAGAGGAGAAGGAGGAGGNSKSPCPSRPCPPPPDCPDADLMDDECDGKCPNKPIEKKGFFSSLLSCNGPDDDCCASAC